MESSPALALEELLTKPELLPLLNQMRAALPGHVLDQINAAHDETLAVRDIVEDVMGDQGPVNAGYAPAADYPAWLVLGICETFTNWIAGKATTCMHAADPGQPKPLFAAAWKPGLVVCVRCTRLLMLPPNSVATMTCDGCGHLCTGDQDDGMSQGLTQMGSLIFEFGTCRSCTADIPTNLVK